MDPFFKLLDEECSICLTDKDNFYFKNPCLCKHLICQKCMLQLSKCPYCRFVYSNVIMKSIVGNAYVYRITDLLFPFQSILINAEELCYLSNSNYNLYVAGFSPLYLITDI